ncbi:MAG: hypothetical protein HPY79_07490 [Bacteroidales bacterium]|nr:hypothetical protein [Bacteroidales bacterium]
MRTLNLFSVVMLLAGLVFFTSCKKEGPMGPQGPAGKDGNANVTSITYTISSWDTDNTIWYKDIIDSRITNSILENGDVRVFLESPAQSNVWLNMPFISPHNNYFTTYNYNVGLNVIRVVIYDSDGLLPAQPSSMRIKVVVIDGVSLAKAKKANIILNNYESLKNFFDIKD